MIVNQNGEPIWDQYLTEWSDLEPGELQKLVFMLIHHLGFAAYRTNATKNGNVDLELRKINE